MNGKRNTIWALFTCVIMFLTIHAVSMQSRSLSPVDIKREILNASPLWIMLTLLLMIGFIIFEGLSLRYILRNLGFNTGFTQGLLYSAGDQFFSAITPSATGGQPASAFFMASSGISGGVITVCLLTNLIAYTTATSLIGVSTILIRPGLFPTFSPLSRLLILFGMSAMILLTLLFSLLLKKGELIRRLLIGLLNTKPASHLNLNSDMHIKKVNDLVADYKSCAVMISSQKRILIVAIILDLFQRISQISVTVSLHMALGNSGNIDPCDLWCIQALSQIGSNFVPIPGGMGAADYLMLDGFKQLFNNDYACLLQMMSRSCSFYICTFLSMCIVTVGYIRTMIRQKERGEKTCFYGNTSSIR
ncbi:MAG: flippase-like domain-containing protein [Lachnospiraceae bacterium]|nr:flippase-like domain-containing protein [Lachnospiraceae bacterium]